MIKGKDLLEKLNNLTKEELELPVYCYAAHGQTDIMCSSVGIEYILKEDKYPWQIEEPPLDEDELKDFEPDEVMGYICVSGA